MGSLAGLPGVPPNTMDPSKDTRPTPEVVEIQLLLPRWQVAALEEAAQAHGLTTGQFLRRIISERFTGDPTARR